jgi:hypothetical protein
MAADAQTMREWSLGDGRLTAILNGGNKPTTFAMAVGFFLFLVFGIFYG